jgi:excisionase family DNA binding protein
LNREPSHGKHIVVTDTSNGTNAAGVRLLYTPSEAAQVLGISRSSLYLLLSAGTIPSVRIGASRRIRHRDLVAYTDGLEPAAPSRAESTIDFTRSSRAAKGAAIDVPSGLETPY